MNSCISFPPDGYVAHSASQRYLDLKGYAIADGQSGNQIHRVQVSFDEGQTWKECEIAWKESKPNSQKVYSWTLWRYTIDLDNVQMSELKTNEKGESVLRPMIRAIDNKGGIQKGEREEMFNLRGLLNTSRHAIEIVLV
mmetsp:Transcript_18969/g.29096  ORF Transcript_18969/g.29096 Transcript_18969/m.29096 type:complete len:139 (-) Transcript_18969:90-506(-)